MSWILVTGGAGFIGSHTCCELLRGGYSLVVMDDFSNSSLEVLKRIQEIVGPHSSERLLVVQGDIRNRADLKRAFAVCDHVAAVLHFAGLKAVAESVVQPLRYWDVNVQGSCCLLEVMQKHGCRTVVFSSSASLYGCPDGIPIPETASIRPISPYGQTKAAVERMLLDVADSEEGWRVGILRYFNPIGAHPSGLLGEDPSIQPTHLFPILGEVAMGRRPMLDIYGADWESTDGTCVRDYIHVMDLAEGHRAALEELLEGEDQIVTLNLGTGRGCTVLQLLSAFERACGRPIPYRIAPRRPGDAACSVADPELAARVLGWRATRDLDAMCRDGWRWMTHRLSSIS